MVENVSITIQQHCRRAAATRDEVVHTELKISNLFTPALLFLTREPTEPLRYRKGERATARGEISLVKKESQQAQSPKYRSPFKIYWYS